MTSATIQKINLNNCAHEQLHKFDEGKKILIDPIATLSEHHVSDNDKGYATLDCFIFMDSFGAQKLATNGTQIPYCNAMQDDDWSYTQPVDGDEKIFMCLVDYDLAVGQLAHAAGGTPSKPHEWMVSNLLSGNGTRPIKAPVTRMAIFWPEFLYLEN
jgi:hypothetical protein